MALSIVALPGTGSNELYERLYQADLTYTADCWKLCGDAHCCSFARHKARFRLLAQTGAQELPLLPGEFDFLTSKGWDRQFGDYERRVVDYDFGGGVVRLDAVASRRPRCACDHDTRTVVCRLYPLLPVFDVGGRLLETEPLGLYEELERLDGMAPACRVSELPLEQLNVFVKVCALLGSSPVLLFHLAAYRIAKRHVREHLAQRKAATGKSAFTLFESAFLRRTLFDHDAMRLELAALHAAFVGHYGPRYTEEIQALPKPAALADDGP